MTSTNAHPTLLMNISEGSIYEHLAMEDYLFNQIIPSFLIYINSPVVVIGKHQNPWRETDPLKYPFARRQSGGGAVYHDKGNLNYSFILPKELYNRDWIFSGVRKVLNNLGIHAYLSPAYALFCRGKKISGSAFRQNSKMVLHHGTLLIQTDLDQMKKALLSPYTITDNKSTRSNPSNVLNLTELKPGLTCSLLANALINEFKMDFNLTETDLFSFLNNSEEIVKLIEYHKSMTWRFGNTLPLCNTSFNNNNSMEGIHEKAGLSQ
jgi:lipoate---protein ligase